MKPRAQGALMAAPAVAVLAGVAVVPVLAAVWLSLHRSIVIFHEQRFIGLANFRFLSTFLFVRGGERGKTTQRR